MEIPELIFDENLREMPLNPEATRAYVDNLRKGLDSVEDVAHDLGIRPEIQQNIRLAHVFQWQGLFAKSDELFAEVISVCRTNSEASHYLDFALQHSGKNHFDQARWNEALRSFEEALLLRQRRNAHEDQIRSTELAITRAKFPFGEFDADSMNELLNRADCDPDLAGFVYPDDPERKRLPIYDDSSLVGFATPRPDQDGVWRMGAIYIRPDSRNRGFARNTIARFMKNRRGRAFIEDINLASQAAYRAAGFHIVRSDYEKQGAWWQNFR